MTHNSPSLEDTAPLEYLTESALYMGDTGTAVVISMNEEQFRRSPSTMPFPGADPVGAHVEIHTEEGIYVATVTSPGVITLW